MKATILILTVFIFALISCKKVTDIHIPNCDNLVTDTAFSDTGVIHQQPIRIPNAFTPDRDAFHDTWYIQNLEQYPDAVVNIYDNQAQLVYHAAGNYSEQPWDGTFNGQILPVGTYYYGIQLITIGGHHLGYCGKLYVFRTCLPAGTDTSILDFGGGGINIDPVEGCH
jgi:gliding motility-associated-like protein